MPAQAPGLPTGPAKAPGVTVGGILGGALFILSMGAIFAGDAPALGFDEEGIPLNRLGMRYPRVIDERTGKLIPFPEGELMKIPSDQRTKYDGSSDRDKFITEWHERGYPRPASNWVKTPDLHHIRPLSRGGTNDFWNIVPLPREIHQLFTNYWNAY